MTTYTHSRSLLGFSNEILDFIVSSIEDCWHLLNLAVTCKRLYYLIIPNHIQFRHIRCHPCRDDIWQRLVERPLLAANVRVLDLWCTPASFGSWPDIHQRVPKSIVPKDKKRNINDSLFGFPRVGTGAYLAHAIKFMVSLQSFSWMGLISNEGIMEEIFWIIEQSHVPLQTLRLSHRHVRTLTLNSDHVYASPPTFPLPVRQLQFLTSLSLSNPCPCRACHPHEFYDVIVNCPGLQLRNVYFDMLQFTPAHEPWKLTRLLHHACWPQLQHLTFKVADFVVEDVHRCLLTEFLARHPKLESISISSLGPPRLYAGMLPNLRSLNFERRPPKESLTEFPLPPDIEAKLLHYGPLVYGMEEVKEVFRNMMSLTTCKVSDVEDISIIVRLMPKLEKLYYFQRWHHNSESVNLFGKKKIIAAANSRIEHLSSLPLTHLGGFLVSKELEITTPRHDRLLSTLAEAIPTLQYTEIMHHRVPRWIEIQRNGTGNYMGYKFISREKERRVHPDLWGNFYHGMFEDCL